MSCFRCSLGAEGLGTCLLVTTVVGSGIMAENLSSDPALALLCNTLPTGAILFVLISVLGPVSGAHFNPVVTLVFRFRQETSTCVAVSYVLVQFVGAVIGTWLAHVMFDLPVLQIAEKARTGVGLWVSEVVATFGLVFTILAGLRFRPESIPMFVGMYIVAAYWFTASTSFANPAVALARTLSNTFSGIRPLDVPAFMVAETAGALMALLVAGLLVRGAVRDASAQHR